MWQRNLLWILGCSLCPLSAVRGGDWITFSEETAARLDAIPDLGVDDVDEKDFAWGDLDQDGDFDLVCVRKQPFTSPGGRRNVLFMNEDGVLVDRTLQYASDADDGGQGFLDETNDRDVVLADVNDDGWLDIITAANYGQGTPPELPKTLSHPRIYRNRGAIDDVWQGFVYEEERIPTFFLTPNFSSVAAGDVNGDDFPDLFFVDYYNDLEDRLLVNDGAGFFTDQTMASLPAGFVVSSLGQTGAIADLNGDGSNDVLKSEHFLSPGIAAAYNDPQDDGDFLGADEVYVYSTMGMAVGDLNNDLLLDVVAVEHGLDRYLLNAGNGADGFAGFVAHVLPNETQGFGGNAIIADLNDDGWNDLFVADVDMELPGCTRIADILRNNADPPAITFAADTGGIPEDMLQGVYDAAIFDLNGDGWLDLVLGRCLGLRVWMNVPPTSPGDLNEDGQVDADDLALLLGNWGPCALCPADLDGNGTVDAADLALLLGAWG